MQRNTQSTVSSVNFAIHRPVVTPDALTSRRSYKQAWDEKDAYAEILKGKGTQFDAAVVEAFERAYPKINETRISLQDT